MHAFEYHRPSSSKDAVALAGKKTEGRTSPAARAWCRR